MSLIRLARPTWAVPWLLLQSIAFHKSPCILCSSHRLFKPPWCIYISLMWNALPPIPLNDSNSPFNDQLRCKFHKEVFLDHYPDWICFCSEIYVHLITLSPHSIHKSTIIYCWYYLCVLPWGMMSRMFCFTPSA